MLSLVYHQLLLLRHVLADYLLSKSKQI